MAKPRIQPNFYSAQSPGNHHKPQKNAQNSQIKPERLRTQTIASECISNAVERISSTPRERLANASRTPRERLANASRTPRERRTLPNAFSERSRTHSNAGRRPRTPPNASRHMIRKNRILWVKTRQKRRITSPKLPKTSRSCHPGLYRRAQEHN